MLWMALFCVAVAAYWLWNHYNSRPDEPPYLPGAWPILGNSPYFLYNYQLWTYLNTITEQIHSLGGVVRIKIGPVTSYFVADPNVILTISNTCLEKISVYDFAKSWLGDSLLTSKASTWKTHRKLLNPAFSQSVLNTFISVFNNQARKFVNDLKKEVNKDLFDPTTYIRLNSFEAICHTALGDDFTDTDLKSTYIKNLDVLLCFIIERFIKFWLHPNQIFRFSNLKKKQDDCVKVLHNVSETILKRKKFDKTELPRNICAEESLTGGTKLKSYMDILLEHSQKGMLNDRQVREHTDAIIAGGTDTVAHTLAFIIVLLGSHPAVQDRIVAELKEVFGDEDKDVEMKDLSQLVYLDAVIKETMRLYPAGPIVGRQITKDIKLKNCTLYAGTKCGLILLGANTHPSWGPDRRQFRPERWLDPSLLPENPNTFATFSIGKRTCIGKAYAYMFIKTILTHLLRHYKITADDTQLKLKIDVLLKPESGHFISIEERSLL